jgi:predicted transcriptional regulator
MKTAISLPDAIFKEAERQARLLKKSRSQLYGEALAEYLARHAADRVEDALNNTCAHLGERKDSFVAAASRRTLSRTEW